MAPRIKIVDGQVIATPKRLLDFVAVASWKPGEVSFECIAIRDRQLSPKNMFYLWVGLTGLVLEQEVPPRIKQILVDALQSLKPDFTYRAEIERGGKERLEE